MTNINNKKISKVVKISKILVQIIIRLGIIFIILKQKTELSIKKINSIYFQIIKISIFLNKFLTSRLLVGGIMDNTVKDAMIKTVPMITLAYLEHLISKKKVGLTKNNFKDIIISTGKGVIISTTMLSGLGDLVQEDIFLTFNQAILPVIGMGQQLDKLEKFVKVLMNMAMQCLLLDTVGDVKKISNVALNKSVMKMSDKLYKAQEKIKEKISKNGIGSLYKGKHTRFS